MQIKNRLGKKWKVYVIHHSHTDIGYTERQEKIEQCHVDFIRQAINISKSFRSGNSKTTKGFKWTCETFWAVEQFLKKATAQEKADFATALKYGDIELSGTYLNMTELLDYEILQKNNRKAVEYGEKLGVKVDSAMTADINGYSWGYSQTLVDAGIKHLLSCVHTHHGMFAIGRKQTPFYWETPKGDRLLVWNGEHYMLGNELGLSPGAYLSYTIQDEFNPHGYIENHWEVAEERIIRYLNQLEKEDYPYDFTLVNVMGLVRDNASPNASVIEFIHQWNERFGDYVEFEMTTLSHFFNVVKQQESPIPVYKGDWPDWWSDGVASTAMHTQVFRDAQRTLKQVKKLDPRNEVVNEELIDEVEHQLTMYAEHTWGYHSSVYEPWHPMVQTLAVRKEAYAANANRLIYTALDDVLESRGEAMLSPNRTYQFIAKNIFDHEVEELATLYLDPWEPDLFKSGFEVIDKKSGTTLPHQVEVVNRGYQISVKLKLKPQEEIVLEIRDKDHDEQTRTACSTRLKGNDGVYDIEDLIPLESASKPKRLQVNEFGIESQFVKISWETGVGITSWLDKSTDKELLRADRKHAAFTPIYEVTPTKGIHEIAGVRRKMGRNRKGMDVIRSVGRLKDVKEITNGPLYGIVELLFDVKGMSHFSLLLKVYNDSPRVEVSARMHKESVWEPENVYLAMPFTSGSETPEQLWMEKAGAIVRPGIDQLPGTCLDYYCIQEGLAYVSDNNGLLIATTDTPLIQLGPIEHQRRYVQGQVDEKDDRHLYAWILTNYWETNFKATLGGFYEFRYTVNWGDFIQSPEQAIQKCQSMNTGLIVYRKSNN